MAPCRRVQHLCRARGNRRRRRPAVPYEDSDESPLPHHTHVLQEFHIFGFARSKMTDAEFRNMIAGTLTCRIHAR